MGAIDDKLQEFMDNVTGEAQKRKRAERDELAAKKAKQAIIEGTNTFMPTLDDRRLEYGTDVRPYEAGPTYDPVMQQWIWRGNSQWGDAESAYDGIGPSRFDTMGPSAYSEMGPSAFADMDPSAFADLSFDEGRMGEAEDYFSDLTTSGTDAIADADYAAKTADAEQMRRAHGDAALADAEMRGQGGGGSALLAELSGNQSMASDLYRAGMDFNAMKAGRRDMAGKTVADISERRGRGKLDADALRAKGLDEREIAEALGLDEWEMDKAAGVDEFGLAKAEGGDSFATDVAGGKDAFTTEKTNALDDWKQKEVDDMYWLQDKNATEMNKAEGVNTEREWITGDKNTEAFNDTSYHNEVTAPADFYKDIKSDALLRAGIYDEKAEDAEETYEESKTKSVHDQDERKGAVASAFTYGQGGGNSGGGINYEESGGRSELADPWDNTWDDDDKDDEDQR